MKKIFVFVLGMITGVVLFCVISYFVANKQGGIATIVNPGLTVFDEPGQVLPYKSFQISQVLPGGNALVYASENSNESFYLTCPIAYIFSPNTGGYYDEQLLKTPDGMVVRQAGTYSYKTGAGFSKTVPVLGFYDK